MKKVFTASKQSYGSGFYQVCNTLEELKRAIIDHCYYEFEDDDPERVYSDDLFKEACAEGGYSPYVVDLHPDEEIIFSEYDGSSCFKIEKINKMLLSHFRPIEE
jgi:hypothetical protein